MFECNRFKIVGKKIIGIYDTDILKENIDLFKKVLKYYNIPYKYFNGIGTDKLFIGLIFANKKQKKAYKRMITRYNHFKKLTKAEKEQLRNIKNGYYLSKKYLDNEITDAEYGIYEPLHQYSDYYNNKDCSEWDNLSKGIKYNKKTFNDVFNENKPEKVYKAQIDQIFEYLCKFLSESTIKGTSYEIYKQMIRLHEQKIIRHMNYLKDNPYDDLNEFLECMVRYGATHSENNNFWREVHKELQLSKKPTFRG